MDQSYNDSIRPLLDLADRLVVLLKDTPIKIPRIASCGMQSHGKSSTLESITHISLPKGDGTVTICPIKISLRNTKGEEFARIKFELDDERKYEKISLENIADKINEYQNKVKEENEVKENEVKLFDKVIQVEVNRKNAPNLTLYDIPGLNFNDSLRKKSEEINEKFLKEEETTVLLVISGSEEVTNSYATDWMKKIPGYNKRFIAIITKADFLKNKNLEVYLDQVKSLKLENPASLIINKFKEYEKLSYEEMEKKELELINQIPDIDKFPDVNKGMQSLIHQLIEIQKKDLFVTFSDMASKVRMEIEKNEKFLKSFPSQCDTQGKFFDLLEKYITIFKDKINSKKEVLNCKEDGTPKENLLKYNIQIKYRKHIKNAKLKMNDLFTLSFCNRVTNNIKQFNSDNIPILEDIVPFKSLLRPKIQEILSDFKPTINELFDDMKNNINSLIKESFEVFKPLESKIKNLYSKYSLAQKKKMIDFYDEIYFLETENISTFNIDIINKVNSLNKHINFILFGKLYKNIKQLDVDKFNPLKFINVETESIENDNLDSNENKKENENSEEKKDKQENTTEDKEKDNKNIIFGIENKENNVYKTIDDLTNEVTKNNNFGNVVKTKYKKHAVLIKSLIQINYNYEKEKNTRSYDHDEYAGRFKIAYRPQDIGTFDEKLINEDYVKIYDDSQNEFIPGFQYINKEKLKEFITLIKDSKVQLKTANAITKMVAYLEVMLIRVIDMVFLGIQKYLYDRLTDDKMICHIRNGIHSLSFEKCKRLIEINPELEKKRKENINNIKNLKKALIEIENLNVNNDFFIDDDLDNDEKEEEEIVD